MPSGPGWFLARVSTMKSLRPAITSSPVLGRPSGPFGSPRSGSSARSGTNTVAPLLTVWSTPWSKNWPKNVNQELYGGDSPTSVVTFGMKRVLPVPVHPAGVPCGLPGVGSPPGSHGKALGVSGSCVRTGKPAAATAAGFVAVWSTIRLLATRAVSSKTSPFFCAYVVGVPAAGSPGGAPVGTGSALRNLRDVRRGNSSSDAAKRARFDVVPSAFWIGGNRLLQEPSTVRRPYGVR